MKIKMETTEKTLLNVFVKNKLGSSSTDCKSKSKVLIQKLFKTYIRVQ